MNSITIDPATAARTAPTAHAVPRHTPQPTQRTSSASHALACFPPLLSELSAHEWELILGQTSQWHVRMCSMVGRGMQQVVVAASPIRYPLEVLWEGGDHRAALKHVIRDIAELNPQCNPERLGRYVTFCDAGILQLWSARYCGLQTLPESFGTVRVAGDLFLKSNRLSALPQSFGAIQVGGTLDLSYNLLSSLPESVGGCEVGADLRLESNRLTVLPESIGQLRVGGSLHLGRNRLGTLPELVGVGALVFT
eukprot:TRINITY_DN36882_c0_g1_i2.p1 TRINITY_DN36882_c0_g1~~TRINITY_DN36882_c0_g1_i2.p1  ORF type:complete len:252 (-),score=26.55 TRINITY_DN36882_c0_g1_i2:513-1268(-)